MSELLNLPPAVAKGLAAWHEMVATEDMSDLESLIHPNAVFSSPAYWNPYTGSAAVAHVLQCALSVFTDFTYHRQFATEDGHHVTLEFSAKVGDLELKGVDLIGYDADGLIERFEVMIRPLRGLAALAEEMKQRVDLTVLGKAPG
ncbi:nuclear transport factor 2 family protein [Sporichthya brevicatena]|uniref:Nuclear transport factor 2 family protein n=1 Tax=Sporichthya brevicatena TaxID=171442 RepID=A0ABN1HC27_9ACTN